MEFVGNSKESGRVVFLKKFVEKLYLDIGHDSSGYDNDYKVHYFSYLPSLLIEKRALESRLVVNYFSGELIEAFFDDPLLDWSYHTEAMEFLLKRSAATESILDRSIYHIRMSDDAELLLIISLMFQMDVYLTCLSKNVMFFSSHNGGFYFVSSEVRCLFPIANRLKQLCRFFAG